MKTRVELFDRSLVAQFGEDAAAPKRRAAFAREQLADAQRQNREALGEMPDHRTFVDGAPSEELEKVRPDGRIIFEFEIGVGIVGFVHQALMEASPVKSGTYQKSHAIYADGVEVETPAAAEDAAEVMILPLVPYARKIEGVAGKPPQSTKAPNGVYQVVAQMASRRFGNMARVRFTYMTPVGGASSLAQWAAGAARRRGNTRRRGKADRNMRQPAIIIRFR